MKQHYTLALLLLTFSVSNSQKVEFLNANNINIGIGVGGNLFTRFDTSTSSFDNGIFQMCEVPKGSGKLTTFTAALWFSAFDSAWGMVHCTTPTNNQGDPEFFDGPVAAVYDTTYDKFYKRVFKITREQINAHRALQLPVPISQIDTHLLKWPAIGNPYIQLAYGINITSPLAPFVDVDHNGVYDALAGDYPAICGEEAIFFVFNDDRELPDITNTNDKLGFEIRGLAEVFIDSSASRFEKGIINNTLLVSYEIENKTGDGYRDFYLGMWEDPDLGCFSNDRVGCDTNRNMMFVYNNGIDNNCNGVNGYGNLRIATGTTFLNSELHAFGYFTNNGTPCCSDPGGSPGGSGCMMVRNYLQGYWADGTPFSTGGSGYNTGSPTNFLLPGNPNNPNDWSDQTSGQPSGDRRMFGSAGPMTFGRGEIKHFDFAFLASYDSTATSLTIIDTLKRDADLFQQFYNQQVLGCRQQIALDLNQVPEQLQLSIYPNPAADILNIEAEAPIQQIELIDVLGRTVFTKTNCWQKTAISVSSFSPGVYLVKVSSADKEAVKKVVLNTGRF